MFQAWLDVPRFENAGMSEAACRPNQIWFYFIQKPSTLNPPNMCPKLQNSHCRDPACEILPLGQSRIYARPISRYGCVTIMEFDAGKTLIPSPGKRLPYISRLMTDNIERKT